MIRTDYGGNNPPPLDAFSLHIDDMFFLISNTLSGGQVVNDDQEQALDGLLDDIRKAKKDADAQRALEKAPHDAAAKAVQTAWKPLLDRCDAAATAIKAALTPYREARQRAKDEAATKARAEADAALWAAQEVFSKSDGLEERFAAEEQLKRASKLQAVANKIDRSATGLRTYWEAEITDRKAALLHYIARSPEAFEVLIQDLANHDARNSRAPVPGVTFHERKRAA
jgi:hypothetical protein